MRVSLLLINREDHNNPVFDCDTVFRVYRDCEEAKAVARRINIYLYLKACEQGEDGLDYLFSSDEMADIASSSYVRDLGNLESGPADISEFNIPLEVIVFLANLQDSGESMFNIEFSAWDYNVF